MQSIRTKYFGPTNNRGTRIKATSTSGQSVTVNRDYAAEVSVDERRAAMVLCKKLGWSGCDRMIRGGLTNDESVFVFMPESCKCPTSAFQGRRRR